MDVPAIVESSLDGEEVAAQVSLGGEDELYITPSRTLIYRSEGLLSDESTEEYAHDAERLIVSEGRRKCRFSLEYPLDGTQEFTIPASHSDDALHPVLAGLLNASGVTDPGETVLHTYWFSELTLVITSERLVKHIGEAVWDDEYEEFQFADLTDIAFEHGEHATQLVLACAGRKDRIKIPSDESREFEEHLKRTLYEYYDVSSMGALNEKIATAQDEPEDESSAAGASNVDFGDGIEPLDASPSSSSGDQSTTRTGSGDDPARGTDAEPAQTPDDTSKAATQRTETSVQSGSRTDAGSPGDDGGGRSSAARADERESVSEQPSGAESVESDLHVDDGGTQQGDDAIPAELDQLRTVVEKQNKLLARQQQTIEQLVEELRRGR
jgi:hypothetical protein